jgi:molybdopterin-guanine dinucleotide biosynthesis protein A
MIFSIYTTIEHTGLFESVIVYSKYSNLQLDGCLVERDLTTGTLIDSILESIRIFGEFLAVGGDMPLLDAQTISELVSKYNGTPLAAVDSEGTVEPLFAIYNEQIYDELLKSSKNTKRIFGFVSERFRLIHMNRKLSRKLMNVNTPEDLEKARAAAHCIHEK